MPVGEKFQPRLDLRSGVPVYRQLIDQVLVGIASGALVPGDQLPTVRQLAVDLSVNPNTVIRAYRELDIRGFLTTQQGSGTFITAKEIPTNEMERGRRLAALVGEFVARAGAEGYTLHEVMDRLADMAAENGNGRK